METFLKKLDRLLREEFPGATTQLERWEPPQSAGGFVVWKGFMGMDPRDRVKRVYDSLRSHLQEEGLHRIGLIMPVTPIEMRIRNERMEQEEANIRRSIHRTKSS